MARVLRSILCNQCELGMQRLTSTPVARHSLLLLRPLPACLPPLKVRTCITDMPANIQYGQRQPPWLGSAASAKCSGNHPATPSTPPSASTGVGP